MGPQDPKVGAEEKTEEVKMMTPGQNAPEVLTAYL